MKQIIIAVAFFSLMACSKKDSSINNTVSNEALPKVMFENGKKVQEFFYDNAGRVIKLNRYNDEGADTITKVQENTYDGKGLLIKEGYREPDSSFFDEYDEYTYNEKNERIAHKSYYLKQEQQENGKKDKIYTEGSSWTRTKVGYDNKGRTIRIEGESTYSLGSISKNAGAYTYDDNNNVLTYKIYYKGAADFELQSTETYEYDLNISNPRLFSVFSEFPFNQCKNFKIKTTEENAYDPGKKHITTVAILKKDSKGNITEVKETVTKPSGEVKETITSLQY